MMIKTCMHYYEVIKGNYCVGNEKHIGYGIALMLNDGKNDVLSMAFPDMSLCFDDILSLVKLCNDLCLDPIHLPDVVEDFLIFD